MAGDGGTFPYFKEIFQLVAYTVCDLARFCFSSSADIFIENRGPQGFWGSGENRYLFSRSWGALVIISRDLGSKLMVLGI